MNISSNFPAVSWLRTGLCLALLLAWPAAAHADNTVGGATKIPDRPEKLAFPPLDYEPPDPAQYRVVLTNGPVAYIIPDHELPLVNIVVYIRTGSYVVPEGKECLESLTGYLMARGGTESKSADELDERLDFLAAHLNSDIGETY